MTARAGHRGVAAALLSVALALLAWTALQDARAGVALAAAMLMELVTGREATIPMALAGGVPPWTVALVSITQNLGLAVLLSPLFVRLLAHWRGQGHFLARRLRRLEAAALRHHARIERWGPLGLFAFMLAPFAANGALITALVGRLAGLDGWRLWAPVCAGLVLTASAWTFAYDRVLGALGSMDGRLPIVLTAAMVLLVLGLAVHDEVRHRHSST